MANNTSLSNLLTTLSQAKRLLIIYNGQTSLDVAACATSLFCQARARQQEVTLLSTAAPIVAHSNLVGIDKAQTQLEKRNFIITLDYDETHIDKVVSHLDETNKKLLLVVQPRPNTKPVEESSVHFSYEGLEYDQIVIFDIHQRSVLEKIFGQDSKNLATEKLISLGSRSTPDYATSFCLTTDTAECLSADFVQALQANSPALDADLATNLMLGIEDKTKHFTSCDNPEIFTIAAWLLSQGARRHQTPPPKQADFAQKHLPSLPKTTPTVPAVPTTPADQARSSITPPLPNILTDKILPGGRKHRR